MDSRRRRINERKAATVAALLLVNIFGVTGQAMWAYANLGHNPIVAGGFALTLESISLYLTSQASAALLANDKSAGLRLAAYAVGLLVGAMNYAAHCGPHWRPTAMALAFGMLSTLSPWLWTIQSRRTHRDALAAAGLIDPRTVKVPTALWLRYPGYALAVLSLGIRNGVNNLPTLRAELAERDVLAHLTGVDAVRYAYGVLESYHPHQARLWLAERGVHVDQAAIDEATPARAIAAAASSTPALPVPVSPAAPMVPAGPRDLYVDRQSDLSACQTKADAIRYAYAVKGDASPGEIVRWLADYGVTVQRSEAARIGKELAAADPGAAVVDLAAAGQLGRLAVVPTPTTPPQRVNGSHA